MSLKYQLDEDLPDVSPEQAVAADPAGRPLYSIVLVVSILAVFATQLLVGLEPSILLAGFVKPAFLSGHEYWRILTGATTHGSLLHVAVNCYAFYSFGKIVEMLTNRAHLAIVFLLSCLGGGVLSLIFMPAGISVGASGGIVGLIGYLLVYALRRQFISPEFRKSLLINIGFILIFGLALYNVIDNFGHIGGFITGAVYGLIQIPPDPHVDPREAGPTLDLAGIVAVGLYIASCCLSILLIVGLI